MFRTIYVVFYFIIYLIYLLPKQWKVDRLNKEGKIKEADAIINQVAHDWGKAVVHSTGSKVQVSGLEHIPEGAVLFVSNHQSNLDIPVLHGFIPNQKSFIAKIELANIPIFSKWMERQHAIFIDRSNPRQSLKAINEGISNLKNGYSMVIFPEGTRSKGAEMSEFKKGSLRLATKAKVPIVPVTIDGSYKILEANGNMIKPAEIKVTISKPIYTDHLTKEEANDLSNQVYEIVNGNLKKG